MPKYYKLTNENEQTHGGCQWGENVTHETSGKGELCGPGWTHWYTHPLLAVMLNHIHGNFDLTTAHLWESPEDQVAEKTDHGVKVGCMKGTTARRVPMPEVTLTQKVAFGILCSLSVYREHNYVTWAENWLSGSDRGRQEAAKEARAKAATAVKDWLDANGIKGRVRYYGCPAEEGGAAKAIMVRAGMFDDVDLAITWHSMPFAGVNDARSLANTRLDFTFTGRASHAAAAVVGRAAADTDDDLAQSRVKRGA